MASHHSIVILSFLVIPSINIMVCWVIFKNPPSHCQEWYGMTWNDLCPHPAGMTGMGLEWLDWTKNDGMRRAPEEAIQFPIPSFLVIPAPALNAGTRGMGLEWLRMTRFGGPKFATFPEVKFVNMLLHSCQYFWGELLRFEPRVLVWHHQKYFFSFQIFQNWNYKHQTYMSP